MSPPKVKSTPTKATSLAMASEIKVSTTAGENKATMTTTAYTSVYTQVCFQIFSRKLAKPKEVDNYFKYCKTKAKLKHSDQPELVNYCAEAWTWMYFMGKKTSAGFPGDNPLLGNPPVLGSHLRKRKRAVDEAPIASDSKDEGETDEGEDLDGFIASDGEETEIGESNDDSAEEEEELLECEGCGEVFGTDDMNSEDEDYCKSCLEVISSDDEQADDEEAGDEEVDDEEADNEGVVEDE